MSGHLDRSTGLVGRRQALRLAGAGLVVACLAACREDRPAGAPPVVAPDILAPRSAVDPDEWVGPTAEVRSLDNTFNPDTLEIAVGTLVSWHNAGVQPHDVIPVGDDPANPSWGVIIDDFPPGAEYSYVFTEPGEYPYICTIHGTERMFGMVGTIIVT